MKTAIWQRIETSVYLLIAAVWYVNAYLNWNGDYLDTDNYMHALRLMLFLQDPSYWEQPFLYTNYPFGEILHWTRALDAVWAVFSLPFLWSYNLKDAVFYSGLLITPFFGMAAVYCFLRATKQFMHWKYRLLAAGLIIVQVNVMRVMVLHRPDHHAAFVCLSLFMLWKMVEFVQQGKSRSLIWLAVAAAISLWMAAEGVFLFVCCAAFLVYGYLFLGMSYQNLVRFSQMYTVGVIVCWLLNPPYQGFLYIDTGRLSFFYVLLAGGISLALWLGSKISGKWRRCCCVAGILACGALCLFAAGCFISPLDERIVPLFIGRISEMDGGNIYTLAYPTAGILAMLFMWRKKRIDGVFGYLALSLVLYGGLTAFSMRFLPYSGIYAAIILAWFAESCVCRRGLKVLLVILLLGLEYISFILYAMTMTTTPKKNFVFNLPTAELEQLPKGVFATDLFFAPYVIWFGGHATIASPYHRNVEGILDNHTIFFTQNENEALRLLQKHKVTYIYLSKGFGDNYYVHPQENCDKLYGKILGCGNTPAWLKPLPVSSGKLYAVTAD